MESEDDGSVLRNNPDILSVWATRWDMEFKPSKCQVVHVSGSKRPVKGDYILHGQVLESVSCAKYLGVDISGSLTWNSHIDRIASHVTCTIYINFLSNFPRKMYDNNGYMHVYSPGTGTDNSLGSNSFHSQYYLVNISKCDPIDLAVK